MTSTEDQLLSQIEQTLGSVVTSSLTRSSAGADLYEAYVFSLILEAAAIEGARVSFKNVDGTLPAVFTFRTSPGHLYSRTRLYSNAVVEFTDLPLLEAHTGVYLSGKSGLIHEADVLVLLADEARTCRDNDVPPRSHQALLAVECKFYSSGLQLAMARGFVGLCSDLSSRECFFVTNTTALSVEKLLAHQRKKWQNVMTPGSTVAIERFRNAVQDTFKDFKTRYAE